MNISGKVPSWTGSPGQGDVRHRQGGAGLGRADQGFSAAAGTNRPGGDRQEEGACVRSGENAVWVKLAVVSHPRLGCNSPVRKVASVQLQSSGWSGGTATLTRSASPAPRSPPLCWPPTPSTSPTSFALALSTCWKGTPSTVIYLAAIVRTMK